MSNQDDLSLTWYIDIKPNLTSKIEIEYLKFVLVKFTINITLINIGYSSVMRWYPIHILHIL